MKSGEFIMSPDPHEPMYVQLKELQRRFEAGLPERLADMHNCCDKLVENADREALTALHRLAHKLTGAAGSFNHDTIGDRARALERTTYAWLEQEKLPSREAIDRFRQLIEDIRPDSN